MILLCFGLDSESQLQASIREGGHGLSHLTRSKSRTPAARARKCRTIEKPPDTIVFDLWPEIQPFQEDLSDYLPQGPTLDIGRICDAVKVSR